MPVPSWYVFCVSSEYFRSACHITIPKTDNWLMPRCGTCSIWCNLTWLHTQSQCVTWGENSHVCLRPGPGTTNKIFACYSTDQELAGISTKAFQRKKSNMSKRALLYFLWTPMISCIHNIKNILFGIDITIFPNHLPSQILPFPSYPFKHSQRYFPCSLTHFPPTRAQKFSPSHSSMSDEL